MEALGSDVRHSLRLLARSPAFTAVSVFSLALGIAGNTTIFSVVSAVLLRPLPFPDPDLLVMVRETSPRTGATGIHLSPANFALLKEETRTFAALGAYEGGGVNLVERGMAERVEAGRVSSGLFAALGVGAARGRLFRAGDDLAGQTQVASSSAVPMAPAPGSVSSASHAPCARLRMPSPSPRSTSRSRRSPRRSCR